MKKKSDKTVFILIILAGAIFLALKYWQFILAAVILFGVAVVILYFNNPSFRFWLLLKLHKGKKKPQEPEPPIRKQASIKPPPREQRPKPNVHKTIIIEAPADPKKLSNKQLIDEIVSRGLGK